MKWMIYMNMLGCTIHFQSHQDLLVYSLASHLSLAYPVTELDILSATLKLQLIWINCLSLSRSPSLDTLLLALYASNRVATNTPCLHLPTTTADAGNQIVLCAYVSMGPLSFCAGVLWAIVWQIGCLDLLVYPCRLVSCVEVCCLCVFLNLLCHFHTKQCVVWWKHSNVCPIYWLAQLIVARFCVLYL